MTKHSEILCTTGSRRLSLNVCDKKKHHAPSDLVLISSSRVIPLLSKLIFQQELLPFSTNEPSPKDFINPLKDEKSHPQQKANMGLRPHFQFARVSLQPWRHLLPGMSARVELEALTVKSPHFIMLPSQQ